MTLLLIALSFVVMFFVAITGYIVVMASKPIRDNGQAHMLPWWVKTVIYVWGVPAALFDMILHYVYFTVKLRDWPVRREHVFTRRLQRYRTEGGWRLRKVEKSWEWLNLYDKDHW